MAEVKVKIISPDCETCEVNEENIVLLTSHKNSFVLKASFHTEGTADCGAPVVVPTLAEQCKLKYVWQYLDGDCCIEDINNVQYTLAPTDCSYNAAEPHWVVYKEGVGLKNICVSGEKFVKRYFRVCVYQNVAHSCSAKQVWEPYHCVSDNTTLLLWNNKNTAFITTYLQSSVNYYAAIKAYVEQVTTALGNGQSVTYNADTFDLPEGFADAEDAFVTQTAIADDIDDLYTNIKGAALKDAFDAIVTLAGGALDGGAINALNTDWQAADADTFNGDTANSKKVLLNGLLATACEALNATVNCYKELKADGYVEILSEVKAYEAEVCKYIDNAIFALQQTGQEYDAAIFTIPGSLGDAYDAYAAAAAIATAEAVGDTNLWALIGGVALEDAFDAILTDGNNAAGEIHNIMVGWDALADDVLTAAFGSGHITTLLELKQTLIAAVNNTCIGYWVEQNCKNVDEVKKSAKTVVNCICAIKTALYNKLNVPNVTNVLTEAQLKGSTSLQGLFSDCRDANIKFAELLDSLNENAKTEYKLDDLQTAINTYIRFDAAGEAADLYLNNGALAVGEQPGFINDLLGEVLGVAPAPGHVYVWDQTIANVQANKVAIVTETKKVVDALFNALQAIEDEKCQEPVAVVLETAKLTLDASGSDYVCANLSCYVPHSTLNVEYTLLLDKDVVARQSNPCFRVCEKGEYSVIACLNYAKYCVSQDITESNKVSAEPDEVCPPPPCVIEQPCSLQLCFIGTNADLANGRVAIGCVYENRDASDRLQLFLNGEAMQVVLTDPGANATQVYFNGALPGIPKFVIPSGANNGKAGVYTVVLSKGSSRQSCSDCITVVNSKDAVINFGLRFNLPPVNTDGLVDYTEWGNVNGEAPADYADFEKLFIINPDVTVFEPDCEKDMLVTYYCVEEEDLIKMIDDDKLNVTLLNAVTPQTVDGEWGFFVNEDFQDVDHNDNDVLVLLGDGVGDGLLEGPDADDVPQSGWVLTKVVEVNGVKQSECLGSGEFKGVVDGRLADNTAPAGEDTGRPEDGAYLNFSEMFKLNDSECVNTCETDLYDQLFVLTVYSNDGCKSGEFPFMFKKPLSAVKIVSSNGCILECNKSTVLGVEAVTGGSSADLSTDNYTYQWYVNGDAIEGASGETLTITYLDGEPGVYTLKLTDKGYPTANKDLKACVVDVTSNPIVIVKRFSVKIVDASTGETDLVDLSKAINLKAKVIGVDVSECELKYQWYLKDCNGNLIRDPNGVAKCLSKTDKLNISNPGNTFLNKFIEVTASYSTVESVPVKKVNEAVGQNPNNLNLACVKKHKLHTSKDSVATTSQFSVNFDNTEINLFCETQVCCETTIDTEGFNVLYNWEYMTEENYQNEIIKNKKKWNLNVAVEDADENRINGTVPGTWVSQGVLPGQENCFDFDQLRAQPGVYKLFVRLYDQTIMPDPQIVNCAAYGCNVVHVTKTLHVSIEGDSQYICDCPDSTPSIYCINIEKNIPEDVTVNVQWQICDDFNSPQVLEVANALNVEIDTPNNQAVDANERLAGDALDLGTDDDIDAETVKYPAINLNNALKSAYGTDLAKCIFFDCENKATLKAVITYNNVNQDSYLTEITIEDDGEITEGGVVTDDATLKVEQILKVDLTAEGLSGNGEFYGENIETVILDPSGTKLCANVCGIPADSEKLYIGSNDTVSDYIPETYKWQFKPLGLPLDSGEWKDVTLDTTFNCLTVCEPGYYRVLVRKFLSDHWLDTNLVDGLGPDANIDNAWFDAYLDKKQGNNTIKYYLHGSNIICVEAFNTAPQTVAVRTTSKNVISFNQLGTVVNKSSDFGKLKAYVAPEGLYAYQWYKNGQLIAGANESTYKPALNETVSGAYTVKVSNHKGHIVSNPYNINFKK